MRLHSERQSIALPKAALPKPALPKPLPKAFPVGARYVVEGRGGEDGRLQVFSRYVVLPGGRRIKLPTDLGQLPDLSPPRRRRGQKGP